MRRRAVSPLLRPDPLFVGHIASACLAIVTIGAPLSAQPACGRVSIGSHALFSCRSGEGAPTVVLEAGMRSDHRTWRAVIPRVEGLTTVVAYDRAGMGESDGGPLPRTSQQVARELHALLERLRAPTPYVLVGHSIGGRHIRTFASLFPGAVGAVILLDSPHERFEIERLTLLTLAEREARLASLRENRAGLPLSVQREYAGIELSTPPGPLPPVPVVVVAAGRHRWVPAGAADEHERLWQTGQRLLRDSSPQGEYHLLPNAGHNLHLEQSDTVAVLVTTVVRRIRRR